MQEPTLVEPPSLTFHWFQELDLMKLVHAFQLRIFCDSVILAALLRMCYLSFYLTCSNRFIMLLSVFWALGQPLIPDLRGGLFLPRAAGICDRPGAALLARLRCEGGRGGHIDLLGQQIARISSMGRRV